MTERTAIVTLASAGSLALLAWANMEVFLVILGTSAAWCLIIWVMFIRYPKKGTRGKNP